MDESFREFLKIIAPISATLMGFAFLAPVVQAVSSGLFSRTQTCIEPKILWTRIFLVITLPLSVFFWPFLSSLLVLIIDCGKLEIAIKVISIVFGGGILIWSKIVKRRSDLERPILLQFVFNYLPLLFLCYIVYAIISTVQCWSFPPFVYWTNLSFIILGILFLVDNILTPFDRGITFKISELSQEWCKDVQKDFTNMDKALRDRKNALNLLKNLQIQERPRLIAKYCSEIRFLSEQYEGPKDKRFVGLKEELEKLKAREESEGKSPNLNDIFEFDNRRKRIVEEYLPKFERVTDEINTRVKGLCDER
ncbi:MAG: hypothetical protein DDT19_00209 [Syntrophomonadaceae bacterium]|nr:hypothetical protein [Bacillota bacterium]